MLTPASSFHGLGYRSRGYRAGSSLRSCGSILLTYKQAELQSLLRKAGLILLIAAAPRIAEATVDAVHTVQCGARFRQWSFVIRRSPEARRARRARRRRSERGRRFGRLGRVVENGRCCLAGTHGAPPTPVADRPDRGRRRAKSTLTAAPALACARLWSHAGSVSIDEREPPSLTD